MNIRFYNAKILTMEEEKQYRIAEGELWVKGNTICYIGDGSDVATVCQGDEVILWDREIDAEGNLQERSHPHGNDFSAVLRR